MPAFETYDRDVEVAAYRVATRRGDREADQAELARAIAESSARMTAYMLARARAGATDISRG